MWKRRRAAPTGQPALGLPGAAAGSPLPGALPPGAVAGAGRRFHSESALRRALALPWKALVWLLRPFVRRYGIAWRFRRQLVPFVMLALVAGLGGLVAAAGAAGGLLLGGGLVAGAGAWLFTRRWLDEPRERLYAAYVLVAASVWLAGVTTYGWDGRVAGMRMAAWLLAVGMPSSVPWWWRFRHRGPGEIPAEDVEEPVPAIVADWNRYLAAKGRRFEGTYLTDVRPVPEGETATIVLRRGEQKTSDVTMNGELIASAYDKPDTQASVEPDPQGRKSRAKLTLLHRDVLSDVRLWNGSTLDPATGIQEVGTFPDHARAHYRWWVPGDGAVMSFVAGATRTGKSAFLKLLLASATDPRHPVPVALMFADCENDGQSLTLWKPKLRRAAAGKLRTLLQLRVLEQVALYRSREFSTRGWDSFTPSDEFPLIAAVLDEIPALLEDKQLRDETIRILEMLAQRGAKRGIALILVSQMASLEEILSQTLRSMLRSGNVVCFRTGDSVTGGMLGLQIDPGYLPEYFADGTPTKGLGVIKSCDGRQAPTRTDHIGEAARERDIIDAAVETPLEPAAQALYDEIMSTPDDEILVFLGLEAPTKAADDTADAAASPADHKPDVGGTADEVLKVLGDDVLRSRTEISIAVRPYTTSVSTVGYALAQLKAAGLISQPGGERTPYTITDAGRERLTPAA